MKAPVWQIAILVILLIAIVVLSIVLIVMHKGHDEPPPTTTPPVTTTPTPVTTFTPPSLDADVLVYEPAIDLKSLSPGTVDLFFMQSVCESELRAFCDAYPNYTALATPDFAHSLLYDHTVYTPFISRTISLSESHSAVYTLLQSDDGYLAVFLGETNDEKEAQTLSFTLRSYIDYFPVIVSGSASEAAREKLQEVCALERVSDFSSLLVKNLSALASEDRCALPLTRLSPPKTLDLNKKMLALTYDDGPNATYTPLILDALEKYNVKATFFVLGCHIASNEAILKRAFSMGCEIGNHTYLHELFSMNTPAVLKKSIENTNRALCDVIGIGASLLRPPGGALTDRNQNEVLTGYARILWNVDTYDYADGKNADTVYESVIGSLAHGNIVLMHDIHAPSAEAADALIRTILEEGYQLLSVSELLEFAQNGVESDGLYVKIGS